MGFHVILAPLCKLHNGSKLSIKSAKDKVPLFDPCCLPQHTYTNRRKGANNQQDSDSLRKRTRRTHTASGGRIVSDQLHTGDFNSKSRIMRSSKTVGNWGL